MGDLFDVKYYQSAVDSYQFLLHEYPTTRFREEAMLAIAHIQQDDLHDAILAQKSYEEFLRCIRSPPMPRKFAPLSTS